MRPSPMRPMMPAGLQTAAGGQRVADGQGFDLALAADGTAAASGYDRPLRGGWGSESEQRLWFGLLISAGVHILLLMVHFVAPDALNFKPVDTPLEVVLVNAASQTRPDKAEVLAQASNQGGGEQDRGRASSPLPAMPRAADGEAPRTAQARLEKLEQEQRKLLDQLKAGADPVPPEPPEKPEKTETPPEQRILTAAEMAESARAIARMQAVIEKNIDDYNKRPRRLFVGASAQQVNWARYVTEVVQKVERVGTLNYPPEARGRMYGSLRATIEIGRDGQLLSFVVVEPSPHDVLNRAAEKVVRMAAPFGAFSGEMAQQGDILVLTRTFTFTNESVQTR